ncbi:MAG: hypothetical protein LBP22_00960 [Deltaproteobacteria bacterium]|jgi:hypothetical protein|nr:hypothetical protein [Deltaproteobacteria bacterium]
MLSWLKKEASYFFEDPDYWQSPQLINEGAQRLMARTEADGELNLQERQVQGPANQYKQNCWASASLTAA